MRWQTILLHTNISLFFKQKSIYKPKENVLKMEIHLSKSMPTAWVSKYMHLREKKYLPKLLQTQKFGIGYAFSFNAWYVIITHGWMKFNHF